MGLLRKIKKIGPPMNAIRNRVGKRKLTSYKTVNGLNVYISPSGRSYVTKNGSKVYTFGANNTGRTLAFSTKRLARVSNNGYYGKKVFNSNSGYYSAGGVKLYKHSNGKYYNYK
jgi:hypothetical protein